MGTSPGLMHYSQQDSEHGVVKLVVIALPLRVTGAGICSHSCAWKGGLSKIGGASVQCARARGRARPAMDTDPAWRWSVGELELLPSSAGPPEGWVWEFPPVEG
ncbi:hypothetical protein GGX14DRAFT_401545 [Mycena pura]|uniref:Uncharacterized protein n=1 Tax=Mycena pura TaxID=153505 RepID=A0AAD6V471_9AGAR|nr:hypothetical protein GGX14DRAFT_401545 [Mycena pura]